MKEPKPDSKYWPLFRYLANQTANTLTLNFTEIERILQGPLPASAWEGRAFWSNRRRGALQAQAWMAAGYRVEEVRPEEAQVTFYQPLLRYRQKRGGGWDSESIKALRLHMELSQAELAAELGVRQQTISEWETGVYEPRRASSRHLSRVAEQAEFPYEAGFPGEESEGKG